MCSVLFSTPSVSSAENPQQQQNSSSRLTSPRSTPTLINDNIKILVENIFAEREDMAKEYLDEMKIEFETSSVASWICWFIESGKRNNEQREEESGGGDHDDHDKNQLLQEQRREEGDEDDEL